jgi:hypothetical protein
MKTNARVHVRAADVRKIIKDLSLLVVSFDHLGSAYYDRPEQRALQTDKFLMDVKAFKILARIRAVLSKAYNSQSTKEAITELEEEAEKLPYWEEK